MHAFCSLTPGGRLRVSLSAVVAKAASAARAVADGAAVAPYRVHAVPCDDLGDVTAAAAGHGYVVLGSAAGAVAVWRCDGSSVAPVRVGGWCLEGQSVSAVVLAVEDAGLQVVVAMASGDVYNFDTVL